MNQIILCKPGELILKGNNRSLFERQLVKNMRRRLAPYGEFSYACKQSCIYITPLGDVDISAVLDVLSRVFGLVAFSPAAVIDKDMGALLATAPEYLGDLLNSVTTFKVAAKRADKLFPLNSIQIAQELGGHLHDTFAHLEVDVHNPQATVTVEVREQNMYLHGGALPGAGGLPVGTSGKGTVLLSGGIDSPVAGVLMARRGLQLHAVHFESYPYTSQAALDKVTTLAKLMARYTGRFALDVVRFTAIQEHLRATTDESYFTLLMRRSMMRIAARLAQQAESGCLITGEALAQVASQTLGALTMTNEAVSGEPPLPVIRPLIGLDKEDIISLARKYGTFETSILPYEDCCTVFNPKRPKTRPKWHDIVANEQAANLFDLEANVQIEQIIIDNG